MTRNTKTDYRFKLLYAIGIIIIVAGHLEHQGFSLAFELFPPYAFHLGLFVFASGYLYKESSCDTPGKYILKKAGEGIVPDPILKRKKFPFQAPGMSALIKKASDMPFLSEEYIKKYGVFDYSYIDELKQVYAQEGFQLMGAYEIDYLLIAMTVTMLCEQYSLSL